MECEEKEKINLIDSESKKEEDILTILHYLDLDLGGNDSNNAQKIISDKKELCERYLDEIAMVSGIKRKYLNVDNVKSKIVQTSKKRKTDFMLKFEENVKRSLLKKDQLIKALETIESHSTLRKINVPGIKIEKNKNSFQNYLPNKSTINSSLNKMESTEVTRRIHNKFKNNSNSHLFLTNLNDSLAENSQNYNKFSLPISPINVKMKKNYSQNELRSEKYDEFLNSISLEGKVFKNSPSQSSFHNLRMIAKNNIVNNQNFLKNFMKRLNYDELYSENLNSLILDENKEETLISKKILESNKLNLFIDEEKNKPEKRKAKPFNYEIIKEKRKSGQKELGKKKEFKDMTYEERVMEIDRSASFNPEILYKNRFNVLSNNNLRLNGNDIIFSVPKIVPFGLLPPVVPNKNHKYVSDILEITKKEKFKVMKNAKEEATRRKLEKENKIEKNKIKAKNEVFDLF